MNYKRFKYFDFSFLTLQALDYYVRIEYNGKTLYFGDSNDEGMLPVKR